MEINYDDQLKAASMLSVDERIQLIDQLIATLPDGARSWLETRPAAPAKKTATYTVTQVAGIAGVTGSTVSRWFDSGKLRGYRVAGASVARVPRESIVKFAKKNGRNVDVPPKTATVFTSGQAAKILGVSAGTVVGWVRTGKLAGYFISGNQERRVDHDELLKFAKARGLKLSFKADNVAA